MMTMEQMYVAYNFSKEFRDYMDRFCRKDPRTLDILFGHKIIQSIAEYYISQMNSDS